MNLAEELYGQSIKNSIPKDIMDLIKKEVKDGSTSLIIYNNYNSFPEYKLIKSNKENLIKNGFSIYEDLESIMISWEKED
ncbi:nucleotidyltransferase family protein [Clostridium botulinum]|nr:nucleotidyltransferase family protein [Clostridium botulinum]